MSNNCEKVGAAPLYVTCHPLARAFPLGWKDIYFRRLACRDDDGVVRYDCPLCGRRFDHRDINYLQGDHVWPYSVFGESSWANYQLICGNRNASKSNKLETGVRRVLGDGEFRRMVSTFLRGQIEAGKLASDPALQTMLALTVLNSSDPRT